MELMITLKKDTQAEVEIDIIDLQEMACDEDIKPDQIFDEDTLGEWARNNDYVKAE